MSIVNKFINKIILLTVVQSTLFYQFLKEFIMSKLTTKMLYAAIIGAAFMFIFLTSSTPVSAVDLLTPSDVPKWMDPLPVPGLMNNPFANDFNLTIGMYPIEQYYHASFPVPTKMWGYGRDQANAHSPANTIVALRGTPITVHWKNCLVDPSTGLPLKHPFDIDRTIPWADPLHEGPLFTRYDGPIPTCVHLHGGEVKAPADGHYMSWYTPEKELVTGDPNYVQLHGDTYDCTSPSQTAHYENEQPAGLIWYHDHAFGIDRLNVMAGLFGGYAIVDLNDNSIGKIPLADGFDIPLIVQDRKISTDYQIAYVGDVTNPTVHPYWFPEFFGDMIVVNGKIWPYLNVEPREYRFRFLNGSDARFYNYYIADEFGNPIYRNDDPDHLGNPFSFLQIGTDGGFLPHPVRLTGFLEAPAERMDCLFDFSGYEGQTLYIMNDANGPYPDGDPVDPDGNAWILKIVVGNTVVHPQGFPSLDESFVLKTKATDPPYTVERNVVLYEKEGPGGPLAMFLDGIDMSDPRSIYKPVVGTVEKWNIINTTMDAHPMHWHLTQLQILSRQHFYNMAMTDGDPNGYLDNYKIANPTIPIPYDQPLNTVNVFGINPSTGLPYIDGPGHPITDGETNAMKDTWVCHPSEITSFLIKWTQEDNSAYKFDAALPPGYVWHCHILEHEENAMMREIHPINPVPTMTTTNMALWLDSYRQQAYGPVDYTNMMPWLNKWADQSGLGNNAVQPDMDKQPMHDRYGLNCREGVMFMPDMMNSAKSDVMSIPYSASITTNNTNENKPVVDSKDLYVVFRPGMAGMQNMMNMSGKQVIFEAGGSKSGFNIYSDGTSLVFGLWNRNQFRYVTFPTGTLMYDHDKAYLAHFEYNKTTEKFRVILNGAASEKKEFKGIFMDGNDATGLAGVQGTTRFADGTTGTSSANFFCGDLGDVLLFNNFNLTQKASVYKYLSWRFNQTWTYPTTGAPKEGIEIAEGNIDVPATTSLDQNYPNPVSYSTIIPYQIPEESNVSLKVYDILGNEVATLADGVKAAGNYQEYLDTQNLPNGIYVYKLTTGSFFDSKSFVVSK
jgi:spore coat protein A, manganese oxidase